jgi:hypothetical protein
MIRTVCGDVVVVAANSHFPEESTRLERRHAVTNGNDVRFAGLCKKNFETTSHHPVTSASDIPSESKQTTPQIKKDYRLD